MGAGARGLTGAAPLKKPHRRPITAGMSTPAVPRLAKVLLAATVASFLAAIVRDVIGYAPPVLPPACGTRPTTAPSILRGRRVRACPRPRTTGPERAAWIASPSASAATSPATSTTRSRSRQLDSPPFPSPADAGYLSIYPAAYVGPVLLLRARAGRMSPALWLDGLVCALAVAAVGAALVFGVVASTDGPFATVATNLAYPLGDLALLAFVIAVIARHRPRRRRDVAAPRRRRSASGRSPTRSTSTRSPLGTYREYTILDTGWPAAYVLVAFAAWQPAPAPRRAPPARRGMLALPAGADAGRARAARGRPLRAPERRSRCGSPRRALASPSSASRSPSARTCACCGASEAEATTDALTGLGNRRALLQRPRAARAERPAASSRCSTSTASSPTTTASAIPPATRCSRASAAASPRPSPARARLPASAATSSACSRRRRRPLDALARRAPRRALSEHGEQLRRSAARYGTVAAAGRGERRRATRCGSPTSACTRTSAAAGAGATRASTRCCCASLAEHDGELRDHVDDVAELAEAVGRELGLDADDARPTSAAPPTLHDIGKIAIPDAILHAPRTLDADEWEYMRQHTLIGERIISARPSCAASPAIVRSSHERYDGGGYPDGLAGEDDPARRAHRRGLRRLRRDDHRPRLPRGDVRATRRSPSSRRCAGTQFDPRVVAGLPAVLTADASAPAGDGDEPRLGPRVAPTTA